MIYSQEQMMVMKEALAEFVALMESPTSYLSDQPAKAERNIEVAKALARDLGRTQAELRQVQESLIAIRAHNSLLADDANDGAHARPPTAEDYHTILGIARWALVRLGDDVDALIPDLEDEYVVWTDGYDLATCHTREDAVTVADAIRMTSPTEKKPWVTKGHRFELVYTAGDRPVAVPLADGPHRKIEFDLQFVGGDYSGVGAYAYIPVTFVDQHSSIEAAFTAFTGHDARHIVCTHDDELVTADGEAYDEDEHLDASVLERPRTPS